jgi:putative tryptophan/tyrosine transport system substrate-binding protein
MAAKNATQRIPIVMGTSGADPVGIGLVASLARPGQNITGFALMHHQLSAKRLDLLRTIFPDVHAITVLVNPVVGSELNLRATEEAARTHGLASINRVEVPSPEALHALRPEDFADRGPVLVLPDAMFWNNRQAIVQLIAAARLPALYPEREYADEGGLIAYGANVPDNFRRAAGYVDRILKGAHPGDLPVQEPAKIDLIINLRTAKALGVQMPLQLLGRADEVIE